MRRDVHDLNVVGDDIFFQPLSDCCRKAGFKIEQQLVRETKDIQVTLHSAFGGDESGVTTVAGIQSFHIVCHLAVEKACAVGACDAEPASKAEVDDAGGLMQ